MKIKGRALNLGDNIDTDLIINTAHCKENELAEYVFADIDPDLHNHVPEKILVAGINFGLGSSRESAPIAIKVAGAKAVLAKSFARIFFRNAINIALPVFIADTDKINDGDELEILVEESKIINHSSRTEMGITPLPKMMQDIFSCGGLVPYLKKNGKWINDNHKG